MQHDCAVPALIQFNTSSPRISNYSGEEAESTSEALWIVDSGTVPGCMFLLLVQYRTVLYRIIVRCVAVLASDSASARSSLVLLRVLRTVTADTPSKTSIPRQALPQTSQPRPIKPSVHHAWERNSDTSRCSNPAAHSTLYFIIHFPSISNMRNTFEIVRFEIEVLDGRT